MERKKTIQECHYLAKFGIHEENIWQFWCRFSRGGGHTYPVQVAPLAHGWSQTAFPFTLLATGQVPWQAGSEKEIQFLAVYWFLGGDRNGSVQINEIHAVALRNKTHDPVQPQVNIQGLAYVEQWWKGS